MLHGAVVPAPPESVEGGALESGEIAEALAKQGDPDYDKSKTVRAAKKKAVDGA